ncbi:MAG: hypothetical protein EXX96DRAFT_562161 [Benjaminiella poitrasii]|nr:MAG: hypothetical protein EXX96DRAFT_562161 [Benjaminiella poitrasii]
MHNSFFFFFFGKNKIKYIIYISLIMTNTRNILQNKRISSLEAAGVKISLKSSTLRKKTVTPTFIKTTDDTASSDSSNKTTRTESNRFNPSSGLEIAIKNEESSATPSSSLLVRNATCCLTSTNFSPGSRKSSTSSKLSNVSPSSSSTGSTSSSSAQQPTPLKNSLKSRKSMSAATKSSSKIASRIYCKSTSLQNSEKLKDKNDILQATLTKKEAVLKVKDKQLEDLKNKLSLLQSEFEDRTPDHYISSESMCSNIKNTTSTVTKTTELEKTREPSLLKPYNRQHGKRRLLLSNEIEDFKRQAEKIKNDFESEKAVLIEQHETAMEKINADTKELIKQMRLEKENLSSILYEKDQLIEKLNTTIQEADQLHQNQIASLKSELNEQHVKDMDSLTSDHEKQISQLQLQIKYQKKQLNGDLQMLKNENELLHKRINDIEEENQQKINQLHTEHRVMYSSVQTKHSIYVLLLGHS